MIDRIVWFINNAYKYEDQLLSWTWALAACVAYLVAVGLGKLVMNKCTKFDLKAAMGYHNLFLFVWSVAMLSGGLYETVTAFSTRPALDVYCASNYSHNGRTIMTGAGWFWIWLFYVSKFYEFVDTAFIILRKSPLIFLHVYHHAIVVPLALSYLKAGMFFLQNGVISNCFIHSLMYWSYYQTSRGNPPKWKKYLTMAQLIQFVWGILSILPYPYICGTGYFNFDVPDTLVFWFQELVLLTFFALFMAFYNKRYDTTKTPGKTSGVTSPTKTRKVE